MYLNLIQKLNISPENLDQHDFLKPFERQYCLGKTIYTPYTHLILFRMFFYGRKFPKKDYFSSGFIALLQVRKNKAHQEMN